MEDLKKHPKELWGPDLIDIFGPKYKRKHIRKFKPEQREAIWKKLPKYVSTSHLGPFPSLFEVVNLVLSVLKETEALKGVDLDWQPANALIAADTLPFETFKDVNEVYKNNDVQRGIMLQHLFRDILFKFDVDNVLCGLARYSPTEERYILNDAQHRFVACVILGIEYIPLQVKRSDKKSVDVKQYGCVNNNSLPSSEFDMWRNNKQHYYMHIEEGGCPEELDKEQIIAYEVHCIMEPINDVNKTDTIKIIEQNDNSQSGRTCTGIANLLRDYEEFGPEIFERAVKIVKARTKRVYGKVPQQLIEAVCTFIRSQEECKIDRYAMDYEIEQAFRHWCPDGSKVSLYRDANTACKNGKYGDDGENLMTDTQCKLQMRWAAGILKLVRVTSEGSGIEWMPITIKGHDIAADGMDTFNVMPL